MIQTIFKCFYLKPTLSIPSPFSDFSNFGGKDTTIRYKHISILKHNIVDFETCMYRFFLFLFHIKQKSIIFPEFIGRFRELLSQQSFIEINRKMIIRNRPITPWRGNEPLAQGNTLGIRRFKVMSP